MLDDWFALANARFDGWWVAAGRDQWLARPGAGASYAVVFGLVGERPYAVYAISVALMVTAAVLLRRLLVSVGASAGVALGVAIAWLVLPNHGSLLFWPSAVNIALALVLLLAGLLVLARGGTRAAAAMAAVLLTASVLCYEATAPVAIVGAVWIGGRRAALPSLVGMGAAGAWMIAFFHPDKAGLDRWADLGLVLPAHAGWGVLSPSWLAWIGGLAFSVGVVLVLVRHRGEERRLVVTGLVVIALGTLPFVRYFYAPLGAGDRVNVVAAVGAAMAWTGLLRVGLASRAKPIALVAGVVLAAGVAVAQWEASTAWSSAADDARRVLAGVHPAPGEVVVVERPPLRRNVGAFLDRSNIRSAVQLRAGTRDVDAAVRGAR